MRRTDDLPTPDSRSWLPHDVLREIDGTGSWLSSWWTVGVVAVVAALLVVLAVRRRRRSHATPASGGRRRAWPPAVAAILTVALALGLAVNAYVGYVPDVEAARLLLTNQRGPSLGTSTTHRTGSDTVGAVHEVHIPAPADLRVPASSTWVYTPPGYDPHEATRYPVVYLLHGSPGSSVDWFAAGRIAPLMDALLADDLIRPMIVVAPDINGTGPGAHDTECLDSTRGGSLVETYLTDVVVPWVDTHYASLPDWEHRVVGGMSAGGFCALDLGLRHPELYGTILAIEGFGDPGEGGRAMLATTAEVEAHSPSSYLPTMTFAHPVAVFLDAGGDSAEGVATARELARLLRERGQVVELRTEPGQGHTWTMARYGAAYGLVFASRQMDQG